jgi:hypothetical protein
MPIKAEPEKRKVTSQLSTPRAAKRSQLGPFGFDFAANRMTQPCAPDLPFSAASPMHFPSGFPQNLKIHIPSDPTLSTVSFCKPFPISPEHLQRESNVNHRKQVPPAKFTATPTHPSSKPVNALEQFRPIRNAPSSTFN